MLSPCLPPMSPTTSNLNFDCCSHEDNVYLYFKTASVCLKWNPRLQNHLFIIPHLLSLLLPFHTTLQQPDPYFVFPYGFSKNSLISLLLTCSTLGTFSQLLVLIISTFYFYCGPSDNIKQTSCLLIIPDYLIYILNRNIYSEALIFVGIQTLRYS